ncbi:hypothetical protein CROQUDRAFT_90197 [Cronartium quercuum f. sp. fusiforme G11]|uniref:Uncharacterized protein n=1 Tax=Cronartium quercuum f. sp. fusiforme G11 TaxID=708437 RepID=A0A9P6NM52_9BASI|nr:hypothetical protein CROQUDRAFT_90197 [Cronartium quercuum f. sp. fusiforme G11]
MENPNFGFINAHVVGPVLATAMRASSHVNLSSRLSRYTASKLTLYTRETSLAACPEKKLVATSPAGFQLLPPNITLLMSGGIPTIQVPLRTSSEGLLGFDGLFVVDRGPSTSGSHALRYHRTAAQPGDKEFEASRRAGSASSLCVPAYPPS